MCAGATGGMAVWYIGNGNGLSRYGTAAVCAVAVSPLISIFENLLTSLTGSSR